MEQFSSIQDQDTQMGSFNGNLNMFEDMMGMLDEHNTSNPLVGPNVMETTISVESITNYPPYPESFQPNPTEANPGTGTEHSSGQFSTDQISASLQNPIINTNDTAWNSTGPPMSSNYGQQLAMTNNSFGLGSSVPPMYPQFQDDQNNYQFPQLMMPNGQEQQGVVPSLQQLPWPQVVADQMNEYIENGTLSGTGTTEGTTTSQAVRYEIASTPLSTNEVPASTPLSTNGVAVQCDQAKLPESSFNN
ncbi:hypothetical protein SESBI_50728 [Sesbania bispinosa]|nr:hypothetical protein SESBI_50728 [Sesbania bispinosa]